MQPVENEQKLAFFRVSEKKLAIWERSDHICECEEGGREGTDRPKDERRTAGPAGGCEASSALSASENVCIFMSDTIGHQAQRGEQV